MNSVPASLPSWSQANLESSSAETATRAWGERIFELMDQAEAPSLFSRKGFYGALMNWAMQDERFKTQLFRFVDVLPTLQTPAEITRHLREYLDPEQVRLSPAMRAAFKASVGASWLFGAGVKAQISALAHQFMLGDDPRQVARILRDLAAQDISFTVDILGEKVVSEVEADRYAARYVELMELLARETAKWDQPCRSDLSPRGELPRLNVSIKLSALYSQIHPADPDTAIGRISARLRPILRRAKELRAFVNLDMEHYALKDLTLRLFKSVFSEPEFAQAPACGLALQAYLRECETDLRDLVAWARQRERRITVRLVKGAYWDYETVFARQKGWPVPVFEHKAETDANFERLAVFLLENDGVVEAAFGTHNVRSSARVLAEAERLGVPRRHFEFQLLHGMADPLKVALRRLDCRVREYCPVGALLPGMAYLVRRLLENTSNEGFLAQRFAKGASREELLRSPHSFEADRVKRFNLRGEPSGPPHVASDTVKPTFRNEPPTDFTIPAERDKLREALRAVRADLGRRHPLIINHQPVTTRDWTPSLNPADQREIIGYAAQATVTEAEAALAAARAAQRAWARASADERAALLERVAVLLRRDKARLSALEVLEAGKNWIEADADVTEAIDFCNFYAAVMREVGRPRRTQHVAGETNFQHAWPRGTGVVIAPWNFPLAILCGMTAAALVTGNTVVMKPSDQTPIIAARFMELLIEAGLPPGVANLLTGPGGQVGMHLVEHPQVDFIAFTGSKEVGLRIWEAAGRTPPGQTNLKKAICELGGKNALLVDSDADLDEAVTGALTSAFGYQGQKCSALARLIVLADHYERFLLRLIAAADSLRVGPAEQPGNVINPVISRAAQQRILAVIEAGQAEATLAWQGRVPNDPHACYVPPTIFTDVPPGSRLFREEIFGPVLAVTKAKDFDQALALANDSEFALTGGLYSRSPVNIERAKAELVCGNLYINRPITGAIVGRQPFGGFKMSGGGTKAGGTEYLLQFMLPRVITENCLRRGFAPLEESQT